MAIVPQSVCAQPEPQPQPPLAVAIDAIRCELSGLSDQIEALCHRLVPVCIPEGPRDDVPQATVPSQHGKSPLLHELAIVSEHAVAMQRKLDDLNNRLEV